MFSNIWTRRKNIYTRQSKFYWPRKSYGCLFRI